MMTLRLTVWASLAGSLIGCGGQSRSRPSDTVPGFDRNAPNIGGSAVGQASIGRPSDSTPAPPTKVAPSTVAVPTQARSPKPELATLANIIDSDRLVGRTVRVGGKCAGYGGVAGAGPPPRSRSDWVLRADSRLIYVVGAFPSGCAPVGGTDVDVTVLARVAQDTLAPFAGRPGQPRRYLIALQE